MYVGVLYVGASRSWNMRWLASRRVYLWALTLGVGACGALVVLVPVASRVARRPALVEGLSRLLAGQFPWGAATDTNPSGLPLLFAVAFPFYLIGHLGLLEAAGLGMFGGSALWGARRTETPWLRLVALLGLPPFYYELLVRSELFFNMMLALGVMLLADPRLRSDERGLAFYGWAMLFGLVLSTRLIVGLVWAVYLAYRFRDRLQDGLYFAGALAITFGATLLPFIVWDAPTFFREGPLSVQSGYLPTEGMVLFSAAALLVGWKTENLQRLLRRTGVLLFMVTAATFLRAALRFGGQEIVFQSSFDVGYFVFCVPFLVLGLEHTGEQRAKGRAAALHS